MKFAIGNRLAKCLIPAAAALLLAGCADDSNNVGGGGTTSGTTSGSTGGTTSGTTSGSTSGSTGGTTSGTTSGSTSGSTGGTTSGTTSGSTSGSTGGTTSGTTSGSTSGSTGGSTSGLTGGSTGGSTGGTTSGTTGSGIDCSPTSTTYHPLQAPAATVSSSTNNGLCLICAVQNEGNVIDADQTNAATLITAVGVVGAASVTVTDTSTIYTGGQRVGVIVHDPAGALLTANVLQNAVVTTTLNGNFAESSTLSSTLGLDLLSSNLFGGVPALLSFITTLPFNAVRFDYGSTVTALATIDMSNVCVSVGPGTTPP